MTGSSSADGAAVVQYGDWKGANQQWQLVRLGDTSSCFLPSTYRWPSTGPLANPKSDSVALKDFSSVVYNGNHLVYGSTTNSAGSYGSMAFTPFTNWSDIGHTDERTFDHGLRPEAIKRQQNY